MNQPINNNSDQQYWTQQCPGNALITGAPQPQPSLAGAVIAILQPAVLNTTNTRLGPHGNLEFLNLTTGEHNALNTEGLTGVESIVIQPQD